MKEHFFEERGIYYRVSEMRPNLPTIILVHGLSGSSSVWLPYERALESTYNIISPDLRGHGKSQKFLFYSAYTPELIASDIVALLKHLEISKCIIVGHSFGTLLALGAIRQTPTMFSSAILISPTFGASSAWWLPFARIFYSFFFYLSLLLPFDPSPRRHVDYEKLVPTWDWSPRRILKDIHNTTERVYFFCVRHIYKEDTSGWWQDLGIPTLIIHGRRDTVIPSHNAERLQKLMPSSRLILVDDADHMLPLNFPDKISGLIEEFIQNGAP